MSIIDLSHTIVPDMAQWPGDEQPLRLPRRSEHGPDNHLSSALELGCHVGTHIDAPLHFLAGEPGLDKLPVSRFVGRGLVVSVPAVDPPGPVGPEILVGFALTEIDFVLIHTGWDREWGTPRYYQEWPWLSAELAGALAGAGLKGVGLDTSSLDPYDGRQAHDICAAAGLINLENLANLAAVPPGPFLLLVLPLKLYQTEASPVRAVAITDLDPSLLRGLGS